MVEKNRICGLLKNGKIIKRISPLEECQDKAINYHVSTSGECANISFESQVRAFLLIFGFQYNTLKGLFVCGITVSGDIFIWNCLKDYLKWIAPPKIENEWNFGDIGDISKSKKSFIRGRS